VNLAIRCFNLPINFFSILLKYRPTMDEQRPPAGEAFMIAVDVKKSGVADISWPSSSVADELHYPVDAVGVSCLV
jgi:hypothetical protein